MLPSAHAQTVDSVRKTVVAECSAPAPPVGKTIHGTVLQVIDGRTLCVAQGSSPTDWIRITLAGAPKDAARSTLLAASFGAEVDCAAVRSTPGGIEALCEKDGVRLDNLMRSRAVRLQSAAWR
jgi:hypothetical protein